MISVRLLVLARFASGRIASDLHSLTNLTSEYRVYGSRLGAKSTCVDEFGSCCHVGNSLLAWIHCLFRDAHSQSSIGIIATLPIGYVLWQVPVRHGTCSATVITEDMI
jgi:hypothetical protein